MPKIDLYLTVLPTKSNEAFGFMVVHEKLLCRFLRSGIDCFPLHSRYLSHITEAKELKLETTSQKPSFYKFGNVKKQASSWLKINALLKILTLIWKSNFLNYLQTSYSYPRAGEMVSNMEGPKFSKSKPPPWLGKILQN